MGFLSRLKSIGRWFVTNRTELILLYCILCATIPYGLLTPMLPNLIRSMGGGNKEYGLVLTCYSIAQFFGTFITGTSSDFLGRKTSIIICMTGIGTFNTILGFMKTIPLIIICRAGTGLFANILSIAMALQSDTTPPGPRRTLWFGWYGAALGIGTVIGPIFGGLMGGLPIWVPCLLAGGLMVIGLALFIPIVKESLPRDKRRKFPCSKSERKKRKQKKEAEDEARRLTDHQEDNAVQTEGTEAYENAVAQIAPTGTSTLTVSAGVEQVQSEVPKTKKKERDDGSLRKTLTNIKFLLCILNYFTSTWQYAAIQTLLPPVTIDRYKYSTRLVGFVTMCYGLGLCTVQIFVVPATVPKLGEKIPLVIGVVFASLMLLLIGVIPQQWSAWVFSLFFGAGQAFVVPTSTSIFSYFGNERTRGTILGIGQCTAALARAVAPIVCTTMYDAWDMLPFIVTCCISTLGVIPLIFIKFDKTGKKATAEMGETGKEEMQTEDTEDHNDPPIIHQKHWASAPALSSSPPALSASPLLTIDPFARFRNSQSKDLNNIELVPMAQAQPNTIPPSDADITHALNAPTSKIQPGVIRTTSYDDFYSTLQYIHRKDNELRKRENKEGAVNEYGRKLQELTPSFVISDHPQYSFSQKLPKYADEHPEESAKLPDGRSLLLPQHDEFFPTNTSYPTIGEHLDLTSPLPISPRSQTSEASFTGSRQNSQRETYSIDSFDMRIVRHEAVAESPHLDHDKSHSGPPSRVITAEDEYIVEASFKSSLNEGTHQSSSELSSQRTGSIGSQSTEPERSVPVPAPSSSSYKPKMLSISAFPLNPNKAPVPQKLDQPKFISIASQNPNPQPPFLFQGLNSLVQQRSTSNSLSSSSPAYSTPIQEHEIVSTPQIKIIPSAQQVTFNGKELYQHSSLGSFPLPPSKPLSTPEDRKAPPSVFSASTYASYQMPSQSNDPVSHQRPIFTEPEPQHTQIRVLTAHVRPKQQSTPLISTPARKVRVELTQKNTRESAGEKRGKKDKSEKKARVYQQPVSIPVEDVPQKENPSKSTKSSNSTYQPPLFVNAQPLLPSSSKDVNPPKAGPLLDAPVSARVLPPPPLNHEESITQATVRQPLHKPSRKPLLQTPAEPLIPILPETRGAAQGGPENPPSPTASSPKVSHEHNHPAAPTSTETPQTALQPAEGTKEPSREPNPAGPLLPKPTTIVSQLPDIPPNYLQKKKSRKLKKKEKMTEEERLEKERQNVTVQQFLGSNPRSKRRGKRRDRKDVQPKQNEASEPSPQTPSLPSSKSDSADNEEETDDGSDPSDVSSLSSSFLTSTHHQSPFSASVSTENTPKTTKDGSETGTEMGTKEKVVGVSRRKIEAIIRVLPEPDRSIVMTKSAHLLVRYRNLIMSLPTSRVFRGHFMASLSLYRKTAWIACDGFPDNVFCDLRRVKPAHFPYCVSGAVVEFQIELNERPQSFFAAVLPSVLTKVEKPYTETKKRKS
ncbi:putative tetracycline resistance MFS efflux pump [Blattamonas nauphoetae]|uniref:Tetracycline resistance MFS efflux pump n=1 Tax=Blattamonas nauphoetae TaxID=2049346 RepID=A0ABQ9XEL8_9EUKA|nr:putative tetracycline resistance MFS efflux pump [Blattamonas nauphoetae]